ncbi:cobalamin B12-binding domain-containing protein [Desulfococcus sp.]|uniref:cobalamin B12-binding domain-containing protein n=1 Tax=Desulfococcus sp. TaxID=2025834 RepID=UPI0035936DAF
MDRKVRVVMAKLGLDIHWRGVYLVSQFMKDAGMEVIYLGNKFPDQIVEAAVEEDADVIGLSTLGGAHMTLGPRVVRLLKEKGMEHIKVFMGGVMAPKDARTLEREHGIEKVYLPDTPMQVIIDGINECVTLAQELNVAMNA